MTISPIRSRISIAITIILGLLVWYFPQTVQAQEPQFSFSALSALTENSTTVAWGDVDNDGDLDLAIGNGATIRGEAIADRERRNRIYRNDNGQLTLAWSSVLTSITSSIAWGDYDNDGDLDLAVGTGCSLTRGICEPNYILRNETVSSTFIFTVDETDLPPDENAFTSSIAWGDYDDDGDLDLAVGNGTIEKFDISAYQGIITSLNLELDDFYIPTGYPNQIYRNQLNDSQTDSPTFTLAWSSEEADLTSSVAWGDYDNDGYLDLAVGNANIDNVEIFLEVGTFTPAITYTLGQVNHVYRYQQTDSFTLAWTTPQSESTFSLAWLDYDQDGDLDLATGNADAEIAVLDPQELQNQELQTFGDFLQITPIGAVNHIYENQRSEAEPFTLSWRSVEADVTVDLAVGDYNNDGYPDLAVGNADFECRSGENQPYPNRIYHNQQGQMLPTAVWREPHTTDCDTMELAWGDYDNDGDLDLVTAQTDFERGQPNRIYRNLDAHLSPITVTDGLLGSLSVAWGDYDGDGDLDFVQGIRDQPTRLYQNEDGRFNLRVTLPQTNAATLAWGDYDGDGDLDLAMGTGDGQPLYIYQNELSQLNLVWTSTATVPTGSVAWGDYDNDGDLDLAAGNGDLLFDRGALLNNTLYRNEGHHNFATLLIPDNIDTTSSVAWGDYDNDGDLDLAVGNRDGINLLYRNDEGSLTRLLDFPDDSDATMSVAWGDYDGDGDLDLAVGNLERPDKIYHNDNGIFTVFPLTVDGLSDNTNSLQWADYDGDGDLDLFVGTGLFSNLNRTPTPETNRLYRNDDGQLVSAWVSALATTMHATWGDYDQDGDLDLLTANYDGAVQLYQNRTRHQTETTLNQPPYLTITRPDGVPNAPHYATSRIITAPIVPITYTLFDAESDPIVRIFPELSLNGGPWIAATAAITPVVPLSTSPEGNPYRFLWDAAADDVVRNDNVVFRLRVQAEETHTPIQRSTSVAQSPSFRVASSRYIKVIDRFGQVMGGTQIYADGEYIGQTNQAGLIEATILASGTQVLALSELTVQTTTRAMHDDWAYKVYLTNLSWNEQSEAELFTIRGEGEQVIQIDNPFITFNMVVSIEWDADEAYIEQIERAMRRGSDYLLDLLDGQMAIEQVTIFDRGRYWGDADIQIATKNAVRPHALIGGIISTNRAVSMRFGRAWDRQGNGNVGRWDEPDGYRTIIHELGHYAFFLYDEYLGYTVDQQTNSLLTEDATAFCSFPVTETPAGNAEQTRASAMNWQYTSTELSARVDGVPSLWTSSCEKTIQWLLNPTPTVFTDTGESAWETIDRVYTDTVSPPRWLLKTPMQRGGVLSGPTTLPDTFPVWPTIVISNPENSVTRTLTLFDIDNRPVTGAMVYVTPLNVGDLIPQGFTDGQGKIILLGAGDNDNITAISYARGLIAKTNVGEGRLVITATMGPINQSRQNSTPPYLRVWAAPSQSVNQVDLFVEMADTGNFNPVFILSEPNSNIGQAPIVNPVGDIYRGQISFSSSTAAGIGYAQANVGAETVQVNYRLQAAADSQAGYLHANDGRTNLYLNRESLGGLNRSYIVIQNSDTLPGPAPDGLALVGQLYEITASGLVSFTKSAILKMYYDDTSSQDLGLYHWDATAQNWRPVSATHLENQQAFTAAIQPLGAYGLFAPADGTVTRVNLPILIK